MRVNGEYTGVKEGELRVCVMVQGERKGFQGGDHIPEQFDQ